MTSITTETRQVAGYKRKWSEQGRARVSVDCVFCGSEMIVYLWSLAGSGKKCHCGAKLHHDGSMTKARR